MKDKTRIKNTNKRLAVFVLLAVLIIIALTLYFFVFKTNPNESQATAQNKENAAILKAEKEQAPIVIDDKTSTDSQNKTQNSTDDAAMDADPTVDSSGLSTNLSRESVHPAVVAVLALYQDFLSKLHAVDADQRQAVADQYIADNSALFSPTYGYLGSGTIHLIPQSANITLEDSATINSAIVDPDDPTQTIVQVFLQPDTTWSMLLYVKMNSDGTIGTIENLIVRMNQNAL